MEITKKFEGAVKKQAIKYATRLYSVDDLMQEGYLWLLQNEEKVLKANHPVAYISVSLRNHFRRIVEDNCIVGEEDTYTFEDEATEPYYDNILTPEEVMYMTGMVSNGGTTERYEQLKSKLAEYYNL